MLSAGEWTKNQPNTVLFVMVDENGLELPGLGTAFTVQISKGGASFVASGGAKGEVGLGVYKYTSTAAEANTSGPIFLVVTATGALQQNLEYVVENRIITSIPFTYTVTNSVNSNPVPDVKVYIYADSGTNNIVWTGVTDSFGVARDFYGNLPNLEPGTYYLIRVKSGFTFYNPDVETVS